MSIARVLLCTDTLVVWTAIYTAAAMHRLAEPIKALASCLKSTNANSVLHGSEAQLYCVAQMKGHPALL